MNLSFLEFCLFSLIPSSMDKLIHSGWKYKLIINKTTVTAANAYANEQLRLCFYVLGKVSTGEYSPRPCLGEYSTNVRFAFVE